MRKGVVDCKNVNTFKSNWQPCSIFPVPLRMRVTRALYFGGATTVTMVRSRHRLWNIWFQETSKCCSWQPRMTTARSYPEYLGTFPASLTSPVNNRPACYSFAFNRCHVRPLSIWFLVTDSELHSRHMSIPSRKCSHVHACRYNDASECLGAGIRLGGWEDGDGHQHGQGNNVRDERG